MDDALKQEIEKLRETVGSSDHLVAVDDSDATSDDEGALQVDYDGDLSEQGRGKMVLNSLIGIEYVLAAFISSV